LRLADIVEESFGVPDVAPTHLIILTHPSLATWLADLAVYGRTDLVLFRGKVVSPSPM
jgi:hypothetical protein